jgi:hypothetical protein
MTQIREQRKQLEYLLDLLNSIHKCKSRIISNEWDAERIPEMKVHYTNRVAINKQILARLIIRYNRKLMAMDLLTN